MEIQNTGYTDSQWEAYRQLQKVLSTPPPASVIKVNQGVQYLPTSYLEKKLDEVFGLWEVKNLIYSQPVVNEIVVSLELCVYVRCLDKWITRAGSAATMIQTEKERPRTAEHKISNTLEKMIPKGKAIAFKNAAKNLGAFFGQDLGRKADSVSNYSPVVAQAFDAVAEKAQNLAAIKNSVVLSLEMAQGNQIEVKTILKEFYGSLADFQKADNEYRDLFTNLKNQYLINALPPANNA